MAHLRRGRGQILVLSAFALGVLFVALALILNAAIFTENLASRGDTTGGDEVVQLRDDLRRGVATVLTHENRLLDDHDLVNESVTVSVAELDDALRTSNARRGAASVVSLESTTNGTLVNQTNASRNFSDGNGTADWTIAENVERTRAFELAINRSLLDGSCSLPDGCFAVNVTNGNAYWRLSANATGADRVNVTIDNGTSTDTCTANGSTVAVDVTAGTVGGVTCPALSFDEVPAGSYDLAVENGDDAGGTYSLVVDNASLATSPPPHFGDGPSVTAALYDATLAYEYHTSRLAYESTLRVAPGEAGG